MWSIILFWVDLLQIAENKKLTTLYMNGLPLLGVIKSFIHSYYSLVLYNDDAVDVIKQKREKFMV